MTRADRAKRRREDLAAEHLRLGIWSEDQRSFASAHGGRVKACPLCQQERREDRIMARAGARAGSGGNYGEA